MSHQIIQYADVYLTQSIEAVAVVASDVCMNEDRGQRGCVGPQGTCRYQASLFEAADFVDLDQSVLLGGVGQPPRPPRRDQRLEDLPCTSRAAQHVSRTGDLLVRAA